MRQTIGFFIVVMLLGCSNRQSNDKHLHSSSEQADTIGNSFQTVLAISQLTDDPLGIGLIRITYPENEMAFYTDTIDKKIQHEIVFSENETQYTIIKKHSFIQPVQLIVCDSEENIKYYEIICLEETKNWFRVRTNLDSDNSYWVKKYPFLTLLKWEEYLKGILCVKRINNEDKIFRSHDNSSGIIEFKTEFECFRVLEINGQWMRVGYYSDINEGYIGGEIIDLGWIKWRNDNFLLINYYDH